MFTEQDTACIRAHGLTPEAVERQLENFRRGFPFLKVVRAAAPGDGILVPAPQEVAAAVRRYDEAAARLGIVKFVPASGAATRMFKELFAFVEEGRGSPACCRTSNASPSGPNCAPRCLPAPTTAPWSNTSSARDSATEAGPRGW